MTWIEDHLGLPPEEFFRREADKIYTATATFDDRYVWEEITPANLETMPAPVRSELHSLQPVQDEIGFVEHWPDMSRFRLVGCAHKIVEEGVCLFCGTPDPS